MRDCAFDTSAINVSSMVSRAIIAFAVQLLLAFARRPQTRQFGGQHQPARQRVADRSCSSPSASQSAATSAESSVSWFSCSCDVSATQIAATTKMVNKHQNQQQARHRIH
jgi:hypothetical protein